MKKVLILLFVLSINSSCKKSDVPPVVDFTEEVSLILPENLNAPIEPQGDPTYNVIGYGYDVTGKFNDASSIRGRVVDIAAYVAGEKPNNFEPWTNSSFWHDSYDAEHAEVLARKLSDASEVTMGRNFYGGTMSEMFPKTNAFSEKYVYGYYSEYLQYKSFKFWIDDKLIAKFRAYLNPSFQSDIQNLSPEMIVKKYGTHLLAEVILGAKLDILYQAETAAEERSDVQKNGFDAAIRNTFGLWTNRWFTDIDSAKLKKVKSPALSFRVAGGDPSKIKVIETPKGVKVDFSDWLKSAEKQNHVFISTRSTIPLSSMIANEEKRTAVKAYIASYLEDNEVKLTK